MAMHERSEPPGPSEELALGWYLDSDDTAKVAAGARALDRYFWLAGTLSDEEYERTMGMSDEEIRRFRDDHRE